jgi:hypothetical protein
MFNKSTDEPSAISEELLDFLNDLNKLNDADLKFDLQTKPQAEYSNLIITKEMNFQIINNKITCNFGKCGKTFKNKIKFEKHSQKHQISALNFKCTAENCGKVYKTKENLTLHIKNKHLKVKPYKCKYCKHLFSHRNGRIYHERKSHKEEMRFKCNVGGKHFFNY